MYNLSFVQVNTQLFIVFKVTETQKQRIGSDPIYAFAFPSLLSQCKIWRNAAADL